MSGYNFQEFVKDFSYRTKQNMNIIDAIYQEHSDDLNKKVYEVTQVINSLFGMIIVPYEKYGEQLTESEFSDTESYKEIKGLIEELERSKVFIRSTYAKDKKGIGVFSFIRHLRNALAHSGNGRLNFYPVKNNKDNIKAVYFMDKDDKNQNYFFCCKLSIKRIRDLCELIPALYGTIERSIHDRDRDKQNEIYHSQIDHLDRFLKEGDAKEMNDVFT